MKKNIEKKQSLPKLRKIKGFVNKSELEKHINFDHIWTWTKVPESIKDHDYVPVTITYRK